MRHASAVGVSAVLLLSAFTMMACAPVYDAEGGPRTYLGFTIGVSNAPPPPRFHYREQPRVVVSISSGVRVVEAPEPDCDLFYFSGSYWLYSSGYWYRSRSYDGDYRVIEVRRVPRPVLEVPDRHWHHPPGRALGHRKHGDHGNGRGHDRDRW